MLGVRTVCLVQAAALQTHCSYACRHALTNFRAHNLATTTTIETTLKRNMRSGIATMLKVAYLFCMLLLHVAFAYFCCMLLLHASCDDVSTLYTFGFVCCIFCMLYILYAVCLVCCMFCMLYDFYAVYILYAVCR